MKNKVTLVGGLVLAFILGFVSIIQAQADPDFTNLLARLNGGRWVLGEGGGVKVYIEIRGDMLTKYIESMGTTKEEFRIKLAKRKFVVRTNFYGAIYEIDEGGDVITEEITWNRDFPQNTGAVGKYIRVK